MAETVLAAVATAGAVAAILVTYSLARRTAPAADGATDPVATRPDGAAPGGAPESAPVTATDPDIWQSETVSELSAAEELLDRAETEGYQERELVVLGEAAFLVRWRRPRGTPAGPAGQ